MVAYKLLWYVEILLELVHRSRMNTGTYVSALRMLQRHSVCRAQQCAQRPISYRVFVRAVFALCGPIVILCTAIAFAWLMLREQ
jgi:hypothetical protein